MSKSPKEYLKHILDETEYLLESSREITEDRFMRDETLQKAFTRSIEIIGEAVKNLPDDFVDKYETIGWKLIAGMRDRLIHHYFGVDYEIVWDVIKNEVPKLNAEVNRILETL